MTGAFIGGAIGLAVGLAVGYALYARAKERQRCALHDSQVELAQVRAALDAQSEKVTWTEESRRTLENAFKALASDELGERSDQLRTTARDELGNLVSPLKDELTKLDQYVRQLESKREGAYSAIDKQLDLLKGLQESLRDQTQTLANALSAPSTRGRWGELQLRKLVELAGLADHVDYEEQESSEGARPDLVVKLPHKGCLPVDSKVTLGAYVDAMEARDEATRKIKLAEHARAMKSRVRELSQKAYWEKLDNAAEIVVMFVPIEAALGAAFQQDPELFEFAISNKVLIASPVVLFALLKAIGYGWQQQSLVENATEIARQGEVLYDRIGVFVGMIHDLGVHLERSVNSYNSAVGSFQSRLVPAARDLKAMGAGRKDHEELAPLDVHTRGIDVDVKEGLPEKTDDD